MAERKGLSKKIRFEVLKRDSFTCQYCGRSAPDVVLEIDHINPVAKGGTNDIFNLVTACVDCNRGKTDKMLSDASSVKKQKAELDNLQKKKEQLEMMALWRDELLVLKQEQVNSILSLIETYYVNACITDYRIRHIKQLIKRFGFNETYEATEIALDYYPTFYKAFDKIGGICRNNEKERNAKLIKNAYQFYCEHIEAEPAETLLCGKNCDVCCTEDECLAHGDRFSEWLKKQDRKELYGKLQNS